MGKKMNSMYQGSEKFTQEQAVFVIDAILSGAMDQIESMLPWGSKEAKARRSEEEKMDAAISGCMQAASMAVAIFCAQLIDDGVESGIVMDVTNFEGLVQQVVKDRRAGRTPKPGSLLTPKMRPLAGNLVSTLLNTYF